MKEKQELKKSQWKNNDVPLVSISCITFNQSKFIKQTLDGFLMQQTSFPMEILIHDDASTDGTEEIIKEYELRYPNIIKPLYEVENQWTKGRKGDRVFNYPRAKGKYIALCEGDDYWIDPLKIQKQVDFLEQNKDYGLVFTDINKVDKNNSIIEQNSFSNSEIPRCESFEDYLIHAPFLAPCTWLFRKKLIKERDREYAVGDLPLLLDIAAQSKIHQLRDTTANYRVLLESASHFTTFKQHYAFMNGIYKIQIDYAQKYKASKNAIDSINVFHAFNSYNFAVAERDINQIKKADKLLSGHPIISLKFRIIQLLSKFRLGRRLVRLRLTKKLEYK